MSGQFAQNTTVDVEKTKADIERTLMRYGADQFISGWDRTENMGMVQFRINLDEGSRMIRFVIPMPDENDPDICKTDTGRQRKDVSKHLEQATKARWRALLLVIKAKLEAVEVGVVDFETEFMAHIMLPNGQTMGEHMKPHLAAAYDSGKMPMTNLLELGTGS